MDRVKNWDVRLKRWSDRVVGEPFQWGKTDCASLVRQALDIMYYTPPICPSCLPDYDSESSALRALAETGGVEKVLLEAGAEEHPVTFAQSGDVLIGEEDNGWPTASLVVGGQAIESHVGCDVDRVDLPYDLDLYVLRL